MIAPRLAGRIAVGLLGGSFNPAHEGHRHVSRAALARLGLSQVWWLVSPQNPLKGRDDMAPFEERLASAAACARDPRIRATDFEREAGTRYTIDTLEALAGHFPSTRFVWLMGADNLIELPRWRRWTDIFETVPIAVLARPTYSLRALSGKAAQRFRRYRLAGREAGRLAWMEPPAWVFLPIPLHPASSTAIRARAERRGAAPVPAAGQRADGGTDKETAPARRAATPERRGKCH